MITTKFIVREDKNNSLRIRIASKRQKCEVALGFSMDESTLKNSLSAAPDRKNLHKQQPLSGERQRAFNRMALLKQSLEEARTLEEVNEARKKLRR